MFLRFEKVFFLVGALTAVACGGPICGDGVIDSNLGSGDPNGNADGVLEVCDDGNAIPGDGCNAICNDIESNFSCSGEPTVCVELVEDCTRGSGDEDLDGAADCDDPECAQDPQCFENDQAGQCADGQDSDTDGGADCDDPDGDCLFSADCQTAGDGFRTPLIEQCDDGNLVAGDGCNCVAGGGCTLEPLSTITVAVDEPDLNNVNFAPGGTDPEPKFSVFMPFIDLDFDNDQQPDSSVLAVVTTSDPNICDKMLQNSVQEQGALNVLPCFGGDDIPGTTAIAFVQVGVLGQTGFVAPATFTGDAGIPLNGLFNDPVPGGTTTFTEAGFSVLDQNGTVVSDTTFASDGLGVINLTTATINIVNIPGFNLIAGGPVPLPVGNLTLDYTDIRMIGQFAGSGLTQDLNNDGTNETRPIDQLISGTVVAATCSDFLF